MKQPYIEILLNPDYRFITSNSFYAQLLELSDQVFDLYRDFLKEHKFEMSMDFRSDLLCPRWIDFPYTIKVQIPRHYGFKSPWPEDDYYTITLDSYAKIYMTLTDMLKNQTKYKTEMLQFETLRSLNELD